MTENTALVEWAKVFVPALIAIIGFGIAFWQYVEGRRRQLLIDVQEGDKSTVAFVAMQVWNGELLKRRYRWKSPTWVVTRLERRREKRRKELFQALCLAAVFQKSGKSMSLIHGALASVAKQDSHFRDELKEIVDVTTVAITRSWSYTDLQSGRRRLNSLRAALQLDGDLRLRLDTYEFCASRDVRGVQEDPRLSYEELERAIKQQGSLVVVMPPNGEVPVVSLSFHSAGADIDSSDSNTAAPASQSMSAPGSESVSAPAPKSASAPGPKSVSEHFLRAKYPDTAQPPQEPTAWLACRLAAVIEAIPSYRDANVIAIVPGRQRAFSGKLGGAVVKETALTEETKLTEVRLTGRWPNGDPSFEVPEAKRAAVDGKTVIVLDDVYRSGDTLQAACKAVREAGARKVLGITAICTISPAGDAASDNGGRPS